MSRAIIYKTKKMQYDKIAAIKLIREITGFTLRETVDILDDFEIHKIEKKHITTLLPLHNYKRQVSELAGMGLHVTNHGLETLSVLYSEFFNEFLNNTTFSEEEKDDLKKDFFRFEEELKKKIFIAKLENSF